MAAPSELTEHDLAEIQRRALTRLRDRRVGGRDEPSQKEIAEEIGYGVRHYGDIERGTTELAWEHVLGLMRAYGVPASYVYERLRDAAREVETEKAREAKVARHGPTRSDHELGEPAPRYEAVQPLEERFDVRHWVRETESGVYLLSLLPGAAAAEAVAARPHRPAPKARPSRRRPKPGS